MHSMAVSCNWNIKVATIVLMWSRSGATWLQLVYGAVRTLHPPAWGHCRKCLDQLLPPCRQEGKDLLASTLGDVIQQFVLWSHTVHKTLLSICRAHTRGTKGLSYSISYETYSHVDTCLQVKSVLTEGCLLKAPVSASWLLYFFFSPLWVNLRRQDWESPHMSEI